MYTPLDIVVIAAKKAIILNSVKHSPEKSYKEELWIHDFLKISEGGRVEFERDLSIMNREH